MKKILKNNDFLQKTWIPEGSKEYDIFKLITQENQDLIKYIKKHIGVKKGDLVLDVGGRDGNIAFELQDPKFVHIVDPDPNIKLIAKPAKFWNDKVQNVVFGKEKYDVIICCHVMGYLGLQNSQKEVIDKLVGQLADNGTLAIFYNLNDGYVNELLQYSRFLMNGHYDYFDPNLLKDYRNPNYQIKHLDRSYTLDYKNFEDMARMCWFLFGGIEIDIELTAKKFLPKLGRDLIEPTMEIGERIIFLKKLKDKISLPTLL